MLERTIKCSSLNYCKVSETSLIKEAGWCDIQAASLLLPAVVELEAFPQ